MKKKICRYTKAACLCFAAIFIIFLNACVSQKSTPVSQSIPETTETVPVSVSSQRSAPGSVPAEPIPDSGLDTARFRNLPAEAKEYLETLAEAFRTKDREFLVSQGESQYEKDLRSDYDEETYLAMLYRYGSYSDDGEWRASGLTHLDISTIRGIVYTGWEEFGPALEISGHLYQSNGERVPCNIILLWRLLEIKILGAR